MQCKMQLYHVYVQVSKGTRCVFSCHSKATYIQREEALSNSWAGRAWGGPPIGAIPGVPSLLQNDTHTHKETKK